jgi:hypothetical protein
VSSLFQLAVTRPREVTVAFAVLGLLSLVRRGAGWLQRRAEAREARRAAQVDAAARWALSELRAHRDRWSSVSGTAPPLRPAELRARVPRAVLSEPSLWPRVASAVSADLSVYTVEEGDEEYEGQEHGWFFVGGLPPQRSPQRSPMRSPARSRWA